jgi:hypothetical protein
MLDSSRSQTAAVAEPPSLRGAETTAGVSPKLHFVNSCLEIQRSSL